MNPLDESFSKNSCKARRKPSDFTNARELVDYLSSKHCGDEDCTECLVIDREEAIYFIEALVQRAQDKISYQHKETPST